MNKEGPKNVNPKKPSARDKIKVLEIIAKHLEKKRVEKNKKSN